MTEVRNASSAGEGKYQSYAEYIKVDVECLDEIPCHWQLHALKHALEIRITDGPHETPEFLDEGVPFVSAEAVSKGFIDFSKIRGYISVADDNRFSRKYSPRKFDIYMVKSGATTGITAIVETDEHFNIWSPLAVMRCNKDFEPYYLLNYLRSRTFRESVELNWSFGTQQNIGMGTLENLPICRPPIEEQRTIAAFLDYETARIDQLIAMQQRLIELLKEKRQAVISHAVTKGLNPNAPMKDSGVEWLGQVPEHWDIKRFKYLFKIRKRIAGKTGYDILSITQKGIKIKDITSGEGQLSMDYSKYQLVYKGDFAMNQMDLLTGFVDISNYDGVTSPDYRVFTLEHKTSVEEYYLRLLQMGYLDKLFYPLGQGAANIGRWRLPTEAFNEFLAPCPPYDEQMEIAYYIDKTHNRIDDLLEKAESAINLMKERKIALISAVVTGKIDLRGWRPPVKDAAT